MRAHVCDLDGRTDFVLEVSDPPPTILRLPVERHPTLLQIVRDYGDGTPDPLHEGPDVIEYQLQRGWTIAENGVERIAIYERLA